MDETAMQTRAEQMRAIRFAQREQDDWLEKSGMSLTYLRANGQAGLHGATSARDVIQWIAKGAPVDGVQRISNYSDSAAHWETPLLSALTDGRLSAAHELVNQGADVNALSMTDEHGPDGLFVFSALHMMVSRRNRSGVDFLLGMKADVNLRSSDGSTPITFAAEKDDGVGVMRLLAAGAEKDIVDFRGRRPVDFAGQMTRHLLWTPSPIMEWQMDTQSAMALTPSDMRDLDFKHPVNHAAPAGWRRPSDMTEAFLIAAALEYQERVRVNPTSPFAKGVFDRLPRWCKFDPLKDLGNFGGLVDAETSSPLALSSHSIYADFARGELYVRFSLLELLWEYLAEVLPRKIGPDRDYFDTLRRLEGAVFGKLGTVLFMSALPRTLQQESRLSTAEGAYAAGRGFTSRGPNGSPINWTPDAAQSVDSIWHICFRLIEANSPEYYLQKFAGRVPAVRALVAEGGRLGELQKTMPYPYHHQNCWPGWDFVVAHS